MSAASAIEHDFAERLLQWFDREGRHGLPWQHPRTAYRAWVAEIMLQQTQVATVIPYFERFVGRFPDLQALAAAPLDDVLALWAGLGYYARGRNLHRTATLCVAQHGGDLPRDIDALSALPGIGRSTAAAILAQAHGLRHAILDGNVKRVLCRLFALEGWPGTPKVEKQLWPLATALLPATRLADYTQAIMDFGATRCTRSAPACVLCPFQDQCSARLQGRVEELPHPRPSKVLPQRACSMLLLRDSGGRLLLQRRGPAGVWSGLWSLPQFDDDDAALQWAQQQGRLGATHALPERLHVFSHYKLRIRPLRIDVDAAQRIADNDDLRWVGADALDAHGMPAPVRRLIEALPDPPDATLPAPCSIPVSATPE